MLMTFGKAVINTFINITWPKVCRHLLFQHLIPKSWALIWSWSPLCCDNSQNSSGKAFHEMLEHCCGELLPFSHKSISVGQLGLARSWRYNYSQRCSMGCRSVNFFHTDLDKPFLCGPRFVHGGIIMLKQERAFHKLLPQGWKHRIV